MRTRFGCHVHHAARTLLAARAAQMRTAQTASEEILWQAIRGRRLGLRFRRQVVLGRYIVDFFAPAVDLVVEVDGGVHAGPRQYGVDTMRDRALTDLGFVVYRVAAWRVERNLEGVLADLRGLLR